ncbi:hypothetical protein HU200_010711 [Digitaria exilis]|uniref:DOG1 domain-containing protein n=1 Tax=Digitaria exilis TaxID=1010633 RepID=A0A835FJK3_9POAL|nr:hypothetical protein HU200_010711 [Digitaria exilis]
MDSTTQILSEAAISTWSTGGWQESTSLMYELRAALCRQAPGRGELQMTWRAAWPHHEDGRITGGAPSRARLPLISGALEEPPPSGCFLWLRRFRPSRGPSRESVPKMLLSHVEPLTEQQIVGVYGLQQSALETEEALSQGLDALYQSLSDTVVSDALSCPSNVANYMPDGRRHEQALHPRRVRQTSGEPSAPGRCNRLHQILTTRQMARSLLSVSDYFHRLRTLELALVTRPRAAQEQQQQGHS